MSEKKDYFEYVSNVLGVKSVLLNQDTSTLLQTVPLLVAVQNLEDYATDEKDLLAKMIGAMKIDLSLIKVVNSEQTHLFQPKFLISFVDQINDSNPSVLNHVVTFSPRHLLKNPQDKKRAWDDMQKCIVYFSRKEVGD